MAETGKLRELPSVHEVLGGLELLLGRYPRALVLQEVRKALEARRAGIRSGNGTTVLPIEVEVEQALNRYVSTRLYAKRRSYDQLDTAGLILFGDAEQVTARIRELEAVGMNHLMVLANFGALPAQRVRVSLERFAREVMPRFQR